jgi:hypothetical protein
VRRDQRRLDVPAAKSTILWPMRVPASTSTSSGLDEADVGRFAGLELEDAVPTSFIAQPPGLAFTPPTQIASK